MKTRAAVHLEHGRPVMIDEVDLPDPGPTHVIVKQFASGVCHSQLHQLHNPELRRPLLLGHESTGIVVAKGSQVTHVKDGDRVILTWVRRDLTDGQPPPQPTRPSFRGQPANVGAAAPTGVFTWAETTIAD